MDKRLQALVVDPDARARERLRRGLRRRGFEVITTASRAEAFDLLDGDAAHVLVTDEPGGSYRVVWLGDASRQDVELKPTRHGWKLFDESRSLR